MISIVWGTRSGLALFTLWSALAAQPPAVRRDACPAPRGAAASSSTCVLVTESDDRTELSDDAPTDRLDIALGARPEGEVVVNVASGHPGVASVNPQMLRFDPDDWDQPQAVIVRLEAAADVDASRGTTLTVAVAEARSDPAFGAAEEVVVPVSVDVGPSVTDAPSPGSS